MTLSTVTYDPLAVLQSVPGDPSALSRLVEQEQPCLQRWLRQLLRDDDLAAESVQDTWLTISRGEWCFSARSSDTAGDVRAWLRQIALRAALRIRERQRAEQRRLAAWQRLRPVMGESITPLEQFVEQDRNDLVWAVVAELPTTWRESLELRFRDGLDFAAIGRAQGCTTLTARMRAWRGVRQLRRRLLPLGVLALPGPLLATLGVGAAGAAFEAGALGGSATLLGLVLPRLMPRWLLLAGGLAGIITVVWQFDRMALTSVPAISLANSGLSMSESQTLVEKRPWWRRREKKTSNDVADLNSFDAEDKKEDANFGLEQIKVEMLVIDMFDYAPDFNATHPTVLNLAQRDEVLAHMNEQPGEAMLHSTLLLKSGQHGGKSQIHQEAYVAGYELVKDVVDTVIEVSNYGYSVGITVQAEAGGVRLIEMVCRQSKLMDKKQEIFSRERKDGERIFYPWEELMEKQSTSLALPAQGLFIPSGSSILLPATHGIKVHKAPGGDTITPDPEFRTWWILITPTLDESEPLPPGVNS